MIITGAAGQLAAGLLEVFSASSEIVAVDVDELDITCRDAVRRAFAAHRPDVVLNCAAWNDVDGAEDHPLDALRTNVLGPATLAAAASDANAVLVHYSTDFVFDGETTAPYTEGDAPSPRSVYGMSKLVGEMLVLPRPRTYVLRLESLFGGPRSRSTTDAILTALQGGRPVRVFTDRTVTLSYVPDVAAATRRLLDTRAPAGLYHVVNSGIATWDQVAREAARQLGVEPTLVPVRMADAKFRARRPRYCALSNQKLASVGIPMPPWTDALARHLRQRAAVVR